MKKLLLTLLVGLLAVSLAACGFEKSGTVNNEDPPPEVLQPAEQNPPVSSEEEDETIVEEPEDEEPVIEEPEVDIETSAEQDAVTIQEVVLMDSDGIKIVATDLNHDMESALGPRLGLTVENTTGQDLRAIPERISLNGFSVEGAVMGTTMVENGNTTYMPLYFSSEDIKNSGITTISSINFSCKIIDPDTFKEYMSVGPFTIETSAAGMEQSGAEASSNEQVIYDKNDIRLVVVGVKPSETAAGGQAVEFRMENNSDRYVGINLEDVLLNGYVVYPNYNLTAMPGETRVEYVTFQSSDISNNDITTFESMRVSLVIGDIDAEQVIDRSELIPFEF